MTFFPKEGRKEGRKKKNNPHLASSRRSDPTCLIFGDRRCGCLKSVWKMSGGCLEGVLRLSGGGPKGVWRVYGMVLGVRVSCREYQDWLSQNRLSQDRSSSDGSSQDRPSPDRSSKDRSS